MKLVDLSREGRGERARLVRDAVVGLVQGEMSEEHVSVVCAGLAAAYARVAQLGVMSFDAAVEGLRTAWEMERMKGL